MARLLRVGAGVWAGASLVAAVFTLGAALLHPHGQALLMLGWLLGAAAITVIGAVDLVRRRIGPAGVGIAVVAYAVPLVLVYAALEASGRLAPSAFDRSLASPFLVPLLIVLYLAGAILARAASGGSTSSAVGACWSGGTGAHPSGWKDPPGGPAPSSSRGHWILEAGREAPGPHEVRVTLTRPAPAGRESVRELRGSVPRPPFPVVERIGVPRVGAIVRVREADPGRRLLKEARIPVG